MHQTLKQDSSGHLIFVILLWHPYVHIPQTENTLTYACKAGAATKSNVVLVYMPNLAAYTG